MPDQGTKKKNPQQKFEPTAEQRQRVLTWTGYGMGQRAIASLTINPTTGRGVTVNTLRRNFRHELETGQALTERQVSESLFLQAVGTARVIRIDADGNETVTREAVPPNHVAAIYWTKAQMGWMEQEKRARIEVATARLELARELLKLRGMVDESEDPQEVARQIKAAVDEIEKVTSVPADS